MAAAVAQPEPVVLDDEAKHTTPSFFMQQRVAGTLEVCSLI